MNAKPTFRQLFDSVRTTLPYMVEGAIIGFTEQIVNRMNSMGITRADLAKRLGNSPAYITKLLGGGTNFTLESMVKVAESLDSEIKVQLVPKVSASVWVSVYNKTSPPEKSELVIWSQRNMYRSARERSSFLGPIRVPQLLNDEDEAITPTTR
jgi:transcriptional regulator with XRE-family HTH domain